MALYRDICVSVVLLLSFLGIYPKKILTGEGATERLITGFVRMAETKGDTKRPTPGHGVSKLGSNTMTVMWSKTLKDFNDMGEVLVHGITFHSK